MRLACLLPVLALLAALPARAQEDPVAALAAANDVLAAKDVLAEWDIPVTSGAAAGYVPDETCALCHAKKAESFKAVAMAKSFYRPLSQPVIEAFPGRYHHVPSDRYYEMELKDGAYVFRRYKRAPDGTRIHLFERKVDWILGSGNHARVYLYQTRDGALYQLPLAWYSQGDGHWAMAPGFEFELHLGVARQVRRACMSCHNAYPDVAEGSDRLHMPEVFPKDLPGGIGCQRCHGPGADHVRAAMEGADEPAVRAAIVNPAMLPREQRRSVCYRCHMQPTVAMTGIRRFGRGAYSFRPGDRLDAFRIDLDIVDPDLPKAERFEINHHPYRLEQSRCFIESGGELGCLTCHDPHVKRTAAERPAHYRAACLTCHDLDADGLPLATRAEAGAISDHPRIDAKADCTACHMPERRTQDVIEVTMTDHRIVRDPDLGDLGPGDPTAPIDKRITEVAEVEMLDPQAKVPADEALAARAMAVLHYTGGKAGYAADSLAALLASDPLPHFEPWHALAESLVRRGEFGRALAPLGQAILRAPDHPGLRALEAVALFGAGRQALGLSRLEALVDARADLPLARYQLAVMYRSLARRDDALASARAALSLRSNLWPALRLIGEIELERGRPQAAMRAFKAALAIDPNADRAGKGLVTALQRLGRADEAALYRDAR